MQLIQKRTFWEVYYNPSLNILEAYWKNTGDDMEDEEFKDYLLNFVPLIPKYKVDGFITDTREYHYLMSIELQEWHDKVIAPVYIVHKLKNIVFIMNEDFLVTSLSIQQTFAEENSNQLRVLYTEGLEEARSVFMKNRDKEKTKTYRFYEAIV
ncbi:hypothetical protein BKI52_34190 [marine bacterium AO1-C]|nr:hypothetical protein BKI52_34190 [marine bacterium AO1-C]